MTENKSNEEIVAEQTTTIVTDYDERIEVLFPSDVIAILEAKDAQIKAAREEAIHDYQTNYEQKHIAEAVEVARGDVEQIAHNSFYEGFSAGMDEFRKQEGGISWKESKSYKALNQ